MPSTIVNRMVSSVLNVEQQDEEKAKKYEEFHTEHGGTEEKRKENYSSMVNLYYDLATDFYEYGWGESFHFAHRINNESLSESIKRHEHFLAYKMKLNKDMHVLDVGCGVGGPLREIALFSGCKITGLNNNAYQIERAKKHNRRSPKYTKNINFIKADFMNIPTQDSTYDGVYQIEATCHAPDKLKCYKEIFRVLKPGGVFGGYDWCMTSFYDPNNPEHLKIKADIEIGNGLPSITSCDESVEALKEAGFIVEYVEDRVLDSEVDWYDAFKNDKISLSTLRSSKLGRFFTNNFLWLGENIGIVPKGSSRTAQFLETAANGLVNGGESKLFTPMFFYIARKPDIPRMA